MGGRRLPSLRACVRICAGASNETCAALGMGSGVYATGMEADVEGIIGDMASSPGVVVHGRPVAPHQISRWHFNLGARLQNRPGRVPAGPVCGGRPLRPGGCYTGALPPTTRAGNESMAVRMRGSIGLTGCTNYHARCGGDATTISPCNASVTFLVATHRKPR